ncbi:flagellar basal body protein FliL [Micromonospora sp. NPDC050200]|uniref:LppU/SCO3897 family protein n=1 Tax=Micromonospora sp. NPDC050200 TaxID=3155664 RepID=UPI0033C8FE04
MANYGPPGGGAPEPWGGRRPEDAYGAAPDPRGTPGWGEPHAGYQPHPQAGYAATEVQPPTGAYRSAGPTAYPGDPTPPRPKRGRGPLVAVLAVLAVFVLGGAATLWYLAGRDDESASTAASTASAEPGAALPGPAEPVPTTPAPASSADPRFVKAGQCVRNEGPSGGKPKLLISACAPKTYQVLRRFDGETSGEKDAEAKCAEVAGYTNWYFFDSELDTLDFVLCLKQR